MLTYKDRAWCDMSDCCANIKCDRNLSYDDYHHAQDLRLLILWASFQSADCGFIPTRADYDPTPYCSACGTKASCKCGPIAENE